MDNDIFEDFDDIELDNYSIFKRKEAVFKGNFNQAAEIEEGDLIGGLVEKENDLKKKMKEKLRLKKLMIKMKKLKKKLRKILKRKK